MLQFLLVIHLTPVQSEHGSVIKMEGDFHVNLGEGSGPRKASTEMESWEEPELMQFSAEFSSRAIKRVKRDDGYGHDPGHCGTFVIFPFFGFLIAATFFSVSVINTVNNENNNNNNNNNMNMNMNENVNARRKRSLTVSSSGENPRRVRIDFCPHNTCFLTNQMLSLIDRITNSTWK